AFAIELYDRLLAPAGFALASPRDPDRRGSHLTLHHPQAWQLCQAWKAAGVIPDFRTPDRLRVGFAPLYRSFGELHEAFTRLAKIVRAGDHNAFPAARGRVT